MSNDPSSKVGEAIPLLNSMNPMDRKKAMEILNAYENASARDLAFYSVCAVIKNEIIPEIKIQMLSYLSQTVKNNPSKVKEIFQIEMNNPNESIKGTAQMLLSSVSNPPSASVAPVPSAPVVPPVPPAPIAPVPIQEPIPEPPKKPEKPKRPNYTIDTAEGQILEQVRQYSTSNSGLIKGMIRNGLAMGAKLGGTGDYLKVLVEITDWGTDAEIIAACELIGVIGKHNPNGAVALGKCLKHENRFVREKAAAALEDMGKNAAGAEEYLMEAVNDLSPKVSSAAIKALKKFKSMSKEEKEHMARVAQQEKELEELKKMSQQQVNNSEIKLKPKQSNMDQFQNIFFMSHAVPDFPWVQKVMVEIEKWPGCYCWTCERDIKPGDDWLAEIYKGIGMCNWFLLFWSDNSDNSRWTREEMNEAKQRNIEKGVPRVSVLNLGKKEWPAIFARSQSAMIKSDTDVQNYLSNLKQQLKL